MDNKKLAPIQLTKPQREWLDAERARTGNSYSTIVRLLIQDRIINKAGK